MAKTYEKTYEISIDTTRTNYVPSRPIRASRKGTRVTWTRWSDVTLSIVCRTLDDAKRTVTLLRRAGKWAHDFTDRVKAQTEAQEKGQ